MNEVPIESVSGMAIAGALAPFLISFLKSRNAPGFVNLVIAMLVSLGVAALALAGAGEFATLDDPVTMLGSASLVFAEGQVVYQGLFAGRLERVDNALTNAIWARDEQEAGAVDGGGRF